MAEEMCNNMIKDINNKLKYLDQAWLNFFLYQFKLLNFNYIYILFYA